MNNDRLSDMITRIRNAYMASKPTLSMRHTKHLEEVAKVLVEEKYLTSVSVEEKDGHKTLVIVLTYADGNPALSTIRRISKPGVRMYSKSTTLRPVLSGMGISILSTSQGVMTDRKAKKLGIGGEVLFELW